MIKLILIYIYVLLFSFTAYADFFQVALYTGKENFSYLSHSNIYVEKNGKKVFYAKTDKYGKLYIPVNNTIRPGKYTLTIEINNIGTMREEITIDNSKDIKTIKFSNPILETHRIRYKHAVKLITPSFRDSLYVYVGDDSKSSHTQFMILKPKSDNQKLVNLLNQTINQTEPFTYIHGIKVNKVKNNVKDSEQEILLDEVLYFGYNISHDSSTFRFGGNDYVLKFYEPHYADDFVEFDIRTKE